jgi:hypothetical protein
VTRVRFAEHELLRAADLAADVEAQAHARERHVRGAHDTWGVALGFAVTLGQQGALVGPGFAHDPCGREIVSGRTRSVRPPLRADGPIELVVSAPAPACPTPGGGPVFAWRPVGRPTGDAVALARFVLAGGALSAPDPSARRGTRTRAAARVAAGFQDDAFAPNVLTTLQIDTTAGGFATTPCYFVTVAEPDGAGYAALGEVWRWLRGPFSDVRDASPTGFALDLRLGVHVAGAGGVDFDPVALPDELVVRVEWVGIERPDRCEAATPKE